MNTKKLNTENHRKTPKRKMTSPKFRISKNFHLLPFIFLPFFRFLFPFSCFLLLAFSNLDAEIRAIWVPIWDLKTPEKIDTLIEDVHENNLNQILAEVRYRGDALYFPNKTDSTYENPEKRSYVLNDSLFDPLDYLIKKGKEKNIEVHAWLTMYVITPHKLEYIDPEHIYYQHPEWITADFSGKTMPNNILEGAYLDPGIPEVQEYLFNVVMDIVKNYEIDGIQLDYIRYPDREFGYNEIAYKKYQEQEKFQDAESWQNWKEEQICSFIKKLYHEIKTVSPNTELTAAVISRPDKAEKMYSQNWKKWLQGDYLDKTYLMAYQTKYEDFQTVIDTVSIFNLNKKVVVGLRAWSKNCSYPVSNINDKIDISRKQNFAGIAFFSYTGIKECGYFKGLKIK